MKLRSMGALVGLLITSVAGVTFRAQTLNPSPREVIKQDRDLLAAEVAAIFEASRQALAGRTFRVSYGPGGPGPEFLMGDDGRPRFVHAVSGSDSVDSTSANGQPDATKTTHRDIETLVHYTRTPARGCDGTTRDGELILEYENDGSGWTVKARTTSPMELNGAAFEMLKAAMPLKVGQAQLVGTRSARPFTAPFTLPQGAQGGPPAGTTMSLWLDTESLLPVRWTLTVPAMPQQGIPAIPEFGVIFTYLEGAHLQPPSEIQAPSCIK